MTSLGAPIKVASKSPGRSGVQRGAAGFLRGRLTVVVAAAGYGKTTAARRWLRGARENVAVLDDVRPDHLPAGVERCDRLVLVSRRPLPVAPLLGFGLGAPVEIGPRQLALSSPRVAQLLTEQYGIDDRGVAAAVHRLTAGWPVLVQL